MDLEFTEDQEELRTSVRAVLSRECPIGLVRDVVEKGTGADGLWQRIVALDWPALTVPTEAGGVGLGAVELAVLMEEAGAAILPAPLFSTLGLFVPVVRAAGTPSQCSDLLGRVAGGTLVGTVAWDPPGAVDPAGAVASGDDLVLRGVKHYVTDVDRAGEIVIAVRVDGALTLVVVPRAEVEAIQTRGLDGTRRMWTVVLDGVRVGPDRVLGGPGDKSDAWGRAMDEATAALSMELVGTCSAIFSIALEYAKVREQFGVKIGSFQAMKHKLADMFVAVEAARATAYFAAAAVAEDDPRRSLAASMAKALAGDCQRRLCQEGIQTLGGIGYTWEHDMHLYVKRAISSGAFLGDADHHRARVAALLGVG